MMRNVNLIIKHLDILDISIECEDLKEVQPLLQMFHDAGYKWNDGDSYIPICHSVKNANIERYYNVHEGNFGNNKNNKTSFTFKELINYINGSVGCDIDKYINFKEITSKYDIYTDRELMIKILERLDSCEEII